MALFFYATTTMYIILDSFLITRNKNRLASAVIINKFAVEVRKFSQTKIFFFTVYEFIYFYSFIIFLYFYHNAKQTLHYFVDLWTDSLFDKMWMISYIYLECVVRFVCPFHNVRC